MPNSIIAYTMGGCRYPCRNIEDCSMAARISSVIEQDTAFSWGSRMAGPDFGTMALTYVPKETRKVKAMETVKDNETGEKVEKPVEVSREFLLLEKASIITVTRVETEPGRPYCNVAAVLRGADDGYKARLMQAMKEEGRRLEYTPHDNIIDIMVASDVVECPSSCARLSHCDLYELMDRKIRETEKDMRGRGFTSFSTCEGTWVSQSRVDTRATAYGFDNENGSTFLSLVKVRGDEKPYCVLMVGLHGEKKEERLIGEAFRFILDTEGAQYGARKLE